MKARRTEAKTFRATPSERRMLAADGWASSIPGGPPGHRWLLIHRSRRARTWRSARRYEPGPARLAASTMWERLGTATLTERSGLAP